MPPPILSLVTVNYSSAAAIFALYESLSHISREISWELIVVDNFSCEEEVEKLKNFFVRKKAVHLIFSKKKYWVFSRK